MSTDSEIETTHEVLQSTKEDANNSSPNSETHQEHEDDNRVDHEEDKDDDKDDDKDEDKDDDKDEDKEQDKDQTESSSDSGDDNFLIMTKKESKIWVLLQNSRPIASSFSKSKLSEYVNKIVRETTVEFNQIGPVYVNYREDKFTLSVKNRNMFWATERVITILEISLIDCI